MILFFVLQDLTISLNCFPVINRELKEISYFLTQGINVIPLTTDDQYFDIRNISDTRGTIYKPLNSFSNETNESDYYMIRQGGVARFDSRDAKETINHLIDLIRDERAGFSLLGTDLISTELKQLDQIISRLKQRLEATNIEDNSNSYLLLNCSSKYERATVQYWTTCGEFANNIRSNSKLSVNYGSDIDANNVILITGSSGGRQKLSKEDKLNKLRRMLLSKGRIVTKEDIKALCFEHFGVDLLEVEIKNAEGLHMRPAMQFVDIANRFNSEVTVSSGGNTADGKSIMQMSMLAATCGTRLKIKAEGQDAEKAVSALRELVEEKHFDEPTPGDQRKR